MTLPGALLFELFATNLDWCSRLSREPDAPALADLLAPGSFYLAWVSTTDLTTRLETHA